MEVIGAAASIIQIADAGLKLCDYIESVASANKRLKRVSKNLETTCNVVKEIGEVFKRKETAKLVSKLAVKTACDAAEECQDVFVELRVAITKSEKNRLLFPLKEAKLQLLAVQLEKLKSTLNLLMTLLINARHLQKDGSRVQREKVQELLRARDAATTRYDELRRNHDLLLSRIPPVHVPTPLVPVFGNYSVVAESVVPGTRSLYVAPESLDLSVQMQPGKNNARDQGSSKDAGAITRKTLDTCIHQIFELLWGIKAIAEVMDDVQAATKAHENAHAVYHDVRTTLDNLFLYANQANEGRNPTPDHGRESPSIDLCEPEAGGDERERHRRSRDRDSGGRESEVQRFRAQNEREENETRIQEMDRRRKLELEMEKVKNENGPDDEGKVRQIAEEKMLEEEIHKRVSNFASQESRHGAVFEVPTPTPLEAAISSQAAMPSRVAMLYIKARAARLSRRSMRRSSIGRVASRRSTSRSRARSRSRQRSDSRHASSIGTVASRRSTSRSRARSRSRERSRSRCGSSIGTVASRRSTSRSRARSRLRRSCSRHASRIGTVTSRKSTSRSRSRSRSRMRVSLVSGSEQVEAIEEDEVDDLLHEWTTLYDKEEDP